jgi:energy-coupling factor transporter ATP-binding protein EcfA2
MSRKAPPTSSAASEDDDTAVPDMDRPTVGALLTNLARANDAAKRGAGKDMIMIVGNTGAGKSTLVNFLAGRNLRETRVAGQLTKGFICDDPVMEIGNGFDSMTSFPELYMDPLTNLTYCDCPGFMDNRGVVLDIGNMYALSKMAQEAARLRGLVIVINYHSLNSDRARGLRETMQILKSIFGSHAAATASSILMLVSRVPGEVTLEDLRYFMRDASVSGVFCADSEDSRLFQHLADNCEMYDPLGRYTAAGRLSRDDIVRKLRSFREVSRSALKVGFSPEAEKALSSLLHMIAHDARLHFDEQHLLEVKEFLQTVDGLKVLRSAVVERCYDEFKSHMLMRILEWSQDLEKLPLVKQTGDEFPILSTEVNAISQTMLNRIEEKRKLGERINVAEADLKLTRDELAMSALEKEKLKKQADEDAARAARNEALILEARQEKDKISCELTSLQAEANRLRSELARPRPQEQAFDPSMLFAMLASNYGNAHFHGGGWGDLSYGSAPFYGGGGGDLSSQFNRMSVGSSSRGNGGGGPPRCKDGSLNMKYKCNRGKDKYG